MQLSAIFCHKYIFKILHFPKYGFVPQRRLFQFSASLRLILRGALLFLFLCLSTRDKDMQTHRANTASKGGHWVNLHLICPSLDYLSASAFCCWMEKKRKMPPRFQTPLLKKTYKYETILDSVDEDGGSIVLWYTAINIKHLWSLLFLRVEHKVLTWWLLRAACDTRNLKGSRMKSPHRVRGWY